MRKVRTITALWLLATVVTAAAQQTLTDKLTANVNSISLQQKVDTKELVKDFIDISEQGRNNDAMLLQLYLEVNIPDSSVRRYMETQNQDGSWNDINYVGKKRGGWEPSAHATRIQALAKVYKTPESSFYRSEHLSAVIHKAMDYWFKAKLICPNWWYNDIGIPKLLGPAFLLIKDELTSAEKREAEKVMDKSGFRMTGQNKVWLAGNVFMKALLFDNEKLARQARDTIVSEIYISESEGLQSDYSYHQHGPQMQLGNYGLSYLGSMSYWARVFQGTDMALDSRQLHILSDFFIEGMQWPVWHGYFDVSASGRQVFINSQKGKAHSVAVSAVDMIRVDSAKSKDYKSFIYRNQVMPSAVNNLTGNRYYWRSDYGIQRMKTWFASVRMSSDRTIGFEMINRENLKGAFSADGVLMVSVDGGEYDDIYPVWDWKRLPGLTVADDGQPIKYYGQAKPLNASKFVGGVSDKEYGAFGMVLDRDGIRADKAYFFSDDMIVCLGSGLTSKNQSPLFTTLDQRLMPSSQVEYGTGSSVMQMKDESDMTADNIKWIHSGKVGYIMLKPERMNISTKTQSGSWRSIAVMYEDNQTASNKVFKAVIDHKSKQDESYAYCVVPDITADKLKSLGGNINRRLRITNNKDIQAVAFLDKNMWQMVFYRPGEYSLGKNSCRIRVDKPCIMLVRDNGKTLNVSVSDPTQSLDSIVVQISSKRVKGNVKRVTLPVGQMRGSAVHLTVAL